VAGVLPDGGTLVADVLPDGGTLVAAVLPDEGTLVAGVLCFIAVLGWEIVEEMLLLVACCTDIGEDVTWLVKFVDCTVDTVEFDAKMDDDWFFDGAGEVTDDDGKTDILLELDMETAAQTEKKNKNKYMKMWPRAHHVTCK